MLLREMAVDPKILETIATELEPIDKVKFLDDLRKERIGDLADKNLTEFDIEIDSTHRIEIKTTNKENRIHSFRHNQLVLNNIEIIVASVKIEECEQGTNLLDLMLEVQSQFDDVKKKMLIEKLIRRCGLSNDNKGVICDEQHVQDDIKLYRAIDLPHLKETIPVGITNVSYDVNFDADLPEIQVSDIVHKNEERNEL